ncbi:hypothetical protein ER308_12235 [Egibacter rhizosphaerae]|uniref:Class I SAM-dependent methyltransferase n=1 Tax=Egibacter rhizosphaerae TaxID=1670831 RepID=A0A411YGG4_9ACTN|nr:hypothetical protein [Egibacter rhizosphaerae]QBI20257.1 hypothetical protein ER308_12235 [Egibacter rhizosphaerae]
MAAQPGPPDQPERSGQPAPPQAVIEWFVDELRLDAASPVAVSATSATVDALRSRCPRVIEPRDPAAARPVWPVTDGGASAVVLAGISDHTTARDALDEVLRVLVPGGRIGVAEVVLDGRDGRVRNLERMLDPRVEEGRRERVRAWPAALEGDRRFARLRWQVFQHVELLGPEAVAGRFLALPEVAALPDEDREGLDAQLARAAAEEAGDDGLVELAYRIDAAWTSRAEG